MIKINIYYWNNGSGVLNHSILLKNLLSDYNVVCYDMSKKNIFRKSNFGIFIQNVWVNLLDDNKKNVYFMCEEWTHKSEIDIIRQFDYVFVNSNHAKKLIERYHDKVIVVPFFSLDRYFFPKQTKNFLHFKGKSIQKNTELVRDYPYIRIIDSEQNYLSENDVVNNLNNHDIHICCSLYESWGHYLWEAMSCGKLVICSEIPVFKEYLDPELVKFVPTNKTDDLHSEYKYLKDKKYPLRETYITDKIYFNNLLKDKDYLFEFQNKNSDNIRNYFLYTNKINKKNFLNIVKYII